MESEANAADKRAEKIARQNKNLHGEKGVLGLTGRWRNTYYENGVANPRRPLRLEPGAVLRFKEMNGIR